MSAFFQYVADNYEILLQYTMQHLRIGMLAVAAAIIIGVPLGLIISRLRCLAVPASCRPYRVWH